MLQGKLTGNKPLEKSRRRLEDNIRKDLKEIAVKKGTARKD